MKVEREVTITHKDFSKSYIVLEETPYAAKIEGLRLFLEEVGLPGKPTDFIVRRKNLLKVYVRSLADRRTFIRVDYSTLTSILRYVGLLRRWIRDSKIEDNKKTEATRLLVELEELLN